MTKALSILAILTIAASAQADVVLNEVLGSTGGSDWEFIELYNTGASAVDLTGWQVELWDSDSGTSYGGTDAGAPYVLNGSIPAGGFFLLANSYAVAGYGLGGSDNLQANAVENSSYTVVLADATSAVSDAVFVTDGGAGDAANRSGTAITPSLTVGPDGTFLPAGFYRTTDGGASAGILNFSTSDLNNGTPEGGTPGASNVPEPATMSLLGLGAVALIRRRK